MKKFSKNSIVAALVYFSFVMGFALPAFVFAAGPATVNLGSSSNFVILSKTGVSTTGSTSIVGDIGVSPAAATYITGFGLNLPAYGVFSTSSLVTGKVYASDYANPTPANLTAAVLDMQTAYTDGAGRASNVTELGAGNIGGLTFAPGVYKWSTGVSIPTDITISGGANDVWIFQIAQNLTVSSSAKIVLAGGAQANNIFWIVAGQTTLGTTSVFNGNILDQTAIALNTGATLHGRALSQTAVTLDSNGVTIASSSVSATPATPAVPTVNPAVPATPASGNSMNAGAATPNANATTNANVNASFKRNLAFGSVGDDVLALQVWLNTHGYAVASSGPGSSGNETKTFGRLTRAAVARFQTQVGISPALGYFGAKTQAYLKTNY